MKKRLIIIICFVIAICVILTLMFTSVIPNIFLDRRSLVCSRVYVENETMKQEDYVEFVFDNRGIINGGNKKSYIIFYDETLIQSSYDALKSGFETDESVELKENTIIINSQIELALNEEGMNRKKIKNTYKEYGYECQ